MVWSGPYTQPRCSACSDSFIGETGTKCSFCGCKGNLRPEMPVGEDVVWYRGWEAGWEQQLEFYTGQGYRAYMGGADLDARSVEAGTWNDLLDMIGDEEAAE